MSAAGFVLANNIFVAELFAAAFLVIAWRSPRAISARWLALAYAIGILNAGLEFVLPLQPHPELLGLFVFAVALAAFAVSAIGLAAHYAVKPPLGALALILATSILANAVLMDQHSTSSLPRALVYQLPYFFVHLVGAWVVFRARKRSALDLTLLFFLLLSGAQFVAKPFLAASLGESSTQAYLQSLYGAYSQLFTALLLITNGVLMLLIIVREEMAEMTSRSETDKLSGLLNRRGFEDRARVVILNTRRLGRPLSAVVADLDHFKTINDTHGHEAGDRVITAFADVLTSAGNAPRLLSRMGGEEFAILMPGATLEAAQSYAEDVRSSFAALSIAALGPGQRFSASLGVTELGSSDSLSDLLRRADAALYEAKRGGRDRVCTVKSEPSVDRMAARPQRRKGSRRA